MPPNLICVLMLKSTINSKKSSLTNLCTFPKIIGTLLLLPLRTTLNQEEINLIVQNTPTAFKLNRLDYSEIPLNFSWVGFVNLTRRSRTVLISLCQPSHNLFCWGKSKGWNKMRHMGDGFLPDRRQILVKALRFINWQEESCEKWFDCFMELGSSDRVFEKYNLSKLF